MHAEIWISLVSKIYGGGWMVRDSRPRGSTDWFTGVTSVCPGRQGCRSPPSLAATAPPRSETVRSDAPCGPVAAPSADASGGLSAEASAASIVSEESRGPRLLTIATRGSGWWDNQAHAVKQLKEKAKGVLATMISSIKLERRIWRTQWSVKEVL